MAKAIATILLLAAMFSSCSVMKGWIEEEVKGAVAAEAGKRAPPEIVAQVDTDQSGTTTWDEWKIFLTSGGFISILTWWLNKRMKNKVGNLYAETGNTNAELAKLREVMVKDGKLDPGQ
jgi:hypothetical protein